MTTPPCPDCDRPLFRADQTDGFWACGPCDETKTLKPDPSIALAQLIRGSVRIISRYASGEGFLEMNGAGGYYITHARSATRRNFLEPSPFTISFQAADVQSVDTSRRTITLQH
jgi:hypothetical protein